MAINLRIDKIDIHNLNVVASPDEAKTFGSIVSQILAGASPDVLRDYGYSDDPDEIETPETIAPEDQDALYVARAEQYLLSQRDVDSTTRSNHLRNLVANVDLARKREGFQTNHERQPRQRKKLDTRQAEAQLKAAESLERACGVCALSGNCVLERNLGRWIDVHPYKRDNSGRKRPGSADVKKVESRKTFLKELREDPAVHCDPTKR